MPSLFPAVLSVAIALFGGTNAIGQTKKDAAPIKIITLGDSITKGVRPGVKAEETFASLLQESLKKEGIHAEVTNVGIGGENTAQCLKRLKAQVIDKKPDFVTIMYGANDSYVDKGKTSPRLTEDEYRTNLTKIVSDLRSAGITPILMTTNRLGDKHPNNGAGEHPGKRLEAYVKICREVAKELKVPLVDHYEFWTKTNEGGMDIDKWMTDSCHPNPQGHEEMAKRILPIVLKEVKTEVRGNIGNNPMPTAKMTTWLDGIFYSSFFFFLIVMICYCRFVIELFRQHERAAAWIFTTCLILVGGGWTIGVLVGIPVGWKYASRWQIRNWMIVWSVALFIGMACLLVPFLLRASRSKAGEI